MIRAKKSLGQNFLKDKNTLYEITRQAEKCGLPVLEVGPGKGALTHFLLDAGLRVVAVEKDHRLIGLLRDTFANELGMETLTLIEGDALEVTPERVGYTDTMFQVVANLPYYITGHYLRQTLESNTRPQTMTLMLQKEVVDRIVARDTKESILSVSVKAFGTPSKLCNVDKKYFSPAPKVDSAVLVVSDISNARFTKAGVRAEDFFHVVRMGFSSKRKMLKNNLAPYLVEHGLDFACVAEAIQKTEHVRPENLTVDDWFTVATLLNTRTVKPNR